MSAISDLLASRKSRLQEITDRLRTLDSEAAGLRAEQDKLNADVQELQTFLDTRVLK